MTSSPSSAKFALLHRRRQVPVSEESAPVRERLAMDRQRLDVLAPQALDLAAEVLTRLHAGLCGRMTALHADRTERYRRGQLIGEHALPLEDFAYLILEGGEAALDALDVIEAAIGRTASPLDDAESSGTVARENAGLAEAFAQFEAELARDLEDKVLTSIERERLVRAARRMRECLPSLESAIRRDRER